MKNREVLRRRWGSGLTIGRPVRLDAGAANASTRHVRAFNFFGGVPDLVVPVNLKAGVTTAHRFEPQVNRSYEEFAQHYGCAILPA